MSSKPCRPLLQINGLSIGYRNQWGTTIQVLRAIDLAVNQGETIGLVGESGSGKSTLALAIMGYLRRGSRLLDGRVDFAGMALFQQTAQQLATLRGSRIALIPQNAGQSLTPTMRIGNQIDEVLMLHTTLSSHERSQRVQQLLDQVRLPDPAKLAQRYPHELSGGQQQRVAIAMALAGEPELLVLDEPTKGLDVTTQSHILALLHDLVRASQTAMIYVSHDLEVIAYVCERVAVMYAGEVVEAGPVRDVLRQPKHPYTCGLLAAMPRVQDAVLPQGLLGAPPRLDSVTVGCAFAARCAWADQRCRESSPALEQVAITVANHQVRCHHWQTLAPYLPPLLPLPAATAPTPVETTALLRLQDIEITYHKAGLARRWFAHTDPPPATVSDISLQVEKGETLALVGESGSGKSTLIRAIAGLLTPRRGAIHFAGLPLAPQVADRPANVRRRIQWIFQNPDASLNPRHSVLELLAQPLRLYWGLDETALRARASELLAGVRLGEHYLTRYPAQLSGGEKQRVAIARAFAAQPDLILCDEVTSSLDVSVQAAVLVLLRDLQSQQQTTYIFVSHDLALVRVVSDQVAVLYQGRLCEVGPTPAIFAPPFHPYTATLLNAALKPEAGILPPMSDEVVLEPAPSVRGCPFQHRCSLHLGAICNTESPPWQVAPTAEDIGHRIRCHIPWQQLAAQQQRQA